MSYSIDYQPELIEDTVLRTISGHAEERRFRKQRNKVYTIQDMEAREYAFQSLHKRWFDTLALDRTVQETVAHWPILEQKTSRCLVLRASSSKEVGADLFVSAERDPSYRPQRTVVVKLTSELLADQPRLAQLLRRELLYIVDMLDPEFGYEPALPPSEIGPTYDRLLQERYRILWQVTVDGRLCQAGLQASGILERCWHAFEETFPGSETELRRVFSFFAHNKRPRHAEMVSFCLTPASWLTSSQHESNGICSLCRFPFTRPPEGAPAISPEVVKSIIAENPDWRPGSAICQQCIDLYQLRQAAA